MSDPTVPCKWCATPTPMTGTAMCDPCYQLDRALRYAPAGVVARMLATMPTPPPPPPPSPPPEPRRPVAGWARQRWARQRNGDETWWVLDLAASDAAELYAIVKQYPDRPLTWAVAVDPLDEDSAAWAEGTAADPDAAMLRAEDAAAAMLDAANAALGRVR